jgi:hypothetical protein
MSAAPPKPAKHARRHARLTDLQGRELDEGLTRFFLEERSRRSFGVTGYLVSGGGGGAVACWFGINSLIAVKAPDLVLRLLLAASGLLLLAMVVGCVAALAGYKAFDIALTLSAEDLGHPENGADRWLSAIAISRVASAVLITLGGLTAFAAYVELIWR